MKIGDKFTVVPPNNHLVDTVTKVTDTEIWGTVCSWNIRDCIYLSPDQAQYMEQLNAAQQASNRQIDKDARGLYSTWKGFIKWIKLLLN